MRLAVFDTNVIVSAGVTPGGSPAKLIFDWALAGRVRAVTSPEVVDEYREVVRRPRFQRYGFPPQWLELLIEERFSLASLAPWPYTGPDATDLSFLALAHAAGAWLVTGNLKHFPETIRGCVKVLSPADYLAHLVAQ